MLVRPYSMREYIESEIAIKYNPIKLITLTVAPLLNEYDEEFWY